MIKEMGKTGRMSVKGRLGWREKRNPVGELLQGME